MFSVDKITEIFCIVDDFCIEFDKVKVGHVLDKDNSKKRRNRLFMKLNASEGRPGSSGRPFTVPGSDQ